MRSLARTLFLLPLALAALLAAALTVLHVDMAYAAGSPGGMTNGFYSDPNSSAVQWVAANPGDGRAAAIKASIAKTPAARWFGDWSGTIGTATGAPPSSPTATAVGSPTACGSPPRARPWAAGHTDWCASQYYSPSAPNDGAPGDAVEPDDTSTWHWTDLWYQQNVGTPPADALSHFVVDTSRNGLGQWTPPAGKYSGDPQTWCNPPGRGIGDRATADTGVPLVDAYLWVKTIGESDGQCNRNIPGGTVDPESGIVDPAAGAWWPAQALTLVQNAVPALTFNTFGAARY